MEESEDSRSDFMQRIQSTTTSSSAAMALQQKMPKSNRLDLPISQHRGHYRHLPPSPDSSKRAGIPPIHPHFPPSTYSTAGATAANNLIPIPCHTRSLSQPSFFNLDSLPQFNSPSPPSDVVTDAPPPPHTPPVAAAADGMPPRKMHRRSQSDITLGFLLSVGNLPPLPHLTSPRNSNQFVKQETELDRETEGSVEKKSDADVAVDDLFSAYMNLESLDTLNSSETEEKREDSRTSGTKMNTCADSSENEAESSLQLIKEGKKRGAIGDQGSFNLSGSHHNRSISMDSLMGKLNFGEESPRLPPSPGNNQVGHHSRSGSMDVLKNNTFSLEFGNGDFSGAELKKIMANEKLVEIAMADPKRAKRILANRQSAARSKDRKMRYISELEHKVQTLQTEATTLSAQLTLLQRDSGGLSSQNNELKFRLQAMEQQAQLQDALSEALSGEVQRLKLATGEARLANNLSQHTQLNPQMHPPVHQLQKQRQQCSPMTHFQMQSQQKSNDAAKHDSETISLK